MSISTRITSMQEHIGNIYDTLELGGFNPYLLPKEYTQLEYIESSGTQYIDTNYTPVQGDDFEFKNVTFSVGGALFSAGTGDYQLILLKVNAGYYKYFQTGGASEFAYSEITNGNIKITNGNLYYNNVLKSESTYGGAVNTTLNLFRRANNTSYISAKMGDVIISNNGTVKRHYVPCKRISDNDIGMYEIITKTFFGNSGTDTFTAGAENRQKVVNKNIVNIAPSIKQKYLDYMNNGTQEIWNNWEKVTGTGEEVSLNNTVQAPMDVGVGGNTSQVQYSGKNLFNSTLVQKGFNTTTGALSNQTTRVAGEDYILLKAGSYTVNANKQVVIYVYDENKSYISSESIIEWKNVPYTFILSAERNVRIGFRNSDNSTLTPSDVTNVQLESGSATSYEPYVRSEQQVQILFTHNL